MVLYVAAVTMIILAFGGYAFVQSSDHSIPTNQSLSSAAFTFQDAGIAIPEVQQLCPASGPLGDVPCYAANDSFLYGTVFVNASSPLSCINVYVNGTSEGLDCWNLTATGLLYGQCSGSGVNYSCTTALKPNGNTQTTRTIYFDHQLLNGSSNTPLIVEGKPYHVTLVAQFQDSGSSTVSLTLVAHVVVNSYFTTLAPTNSTTTSTTE